MQITIIRMRFKTNIFFKLVYIHLSLFDSDRDGSGYPINCHAYSRALVCCGVLNQQINIMLSVRIFIIYTS